MRLGMLAAQLMLCESFLEWVRPLSKLPQDVHLLFLLGVQEIAPELGGSQAEGNRIPSMERINRRYLGSEHSCADIGIGELPEDAPVQEIPAF